MNKLSSYFNSYIDFLMLFIGIYMVFVQSVNLIRVDHMKKEGHFVKAAGYIYIAVSVIGFILTAM